MKSVTVADRERAVVGAERERADRADDRAVVRELPPCREPPPALAKGRRVEERHAPVVAAHGQRPAVAAQRVVEHPRAAAVQHRHCGRAAEKRGEQVAPRGERVVEVRPLTGEQQRPVELRLHERLRAEALRGRRRLLVPSRAPLVRRDCPRAQHREQQHERRREQAPQPPVHAPLPPSLAGELVSARLEELALDPVQARVTARAVGPVERRTRGARRGTARRGRVRSHPSPRPPARGGRAAAGRGRPPPPSR